MRLRYQVMPELADEEYQALKDSIAENGVLVPVEYDDEGNILDGHHRVRACGELGIKEWPTVYRVGMSEEEKRSHARRLNMARRHLNAGQKAKMLRAQLKDTPFLSNRQIAKALGVDHKTVGTWREQLESIGEIPQCDRETTDGRIYPRERREAPVAQPSPTKDEVVPTPEPPPKEINRPTSIFLPTNDDAMRKVFEAGKDGSEAARKSLAGLAKGSYTAKRALKELEREKVRSKPQDIAPPTGKYRVVYADPPWCYGDKRDGNTTGAEDHYPSMTIEELAAMPVVDFVDDNAVLFIWVTSPLLEECFEVIRAWGFKYKTSFVWDKVKHNMGHYNSVRHEFLLICTRGSCVPDNRTLYDSVQVIERTGHSVKPEQFRQLIDTLYEHGPRIELFARRSIPGWEVWGNEPSLGSG